MEDDSSKVSYFLLGLGLGVAIGFLFAPDSGEKTRELLLAKADEGRDYLKRRSEELAESATEMVERGKTAVTRQKEQLAAAVEAGKAAYRDSVENPPTASGKTQA
jgi:gas vesicle protein